MSTYFNPGNPFDTGREREENTEVLSRYLAQGDAGREYLLSLGWDPNAPLHAHDNPNMPQYAGSSGGGGGSLMSGAMNSPFYQQALAATQAAAAADAASRRAAIQQMLIQFGEVPTGFTDPYGDIDQTTRDLATQNTTSGISIAARLKQALADAQRQSSRQLSARGLRRSGARGYQMRRSQLGFDQNYSDAVSKLLGGSQDVYKGFSQGEYNRSMSLAQALQSAINSMSSFYRPTGGGYSAPSGGGGGGLTYYQSAAGPSPYAPTSTGGVGGNQPGYYTGGALYATQSENPRINSTFWFK